MARGVDPRWDTQLRPHEVKVAELLSPRRNRISARLHSQRLINDDEDERFTNSDKTETDLALDVLRVLRRQGPGSFDTFCDLLLDANDDTLRGVERLLRPSSQNSLEARHLAKHSGSLVAETPLQLSSQTKSLDAASCPAVVVTDESDWEKFGFHSNDMAEALLPCLLLDHLLQKGVTA